MNVDSFDEHKLNRLIINAKDFCLTNGIEFFVILELQKKTLTIFNNYINSRFGYVYNNGSRPKKECKCVSFSNYIISV